MPQLYYMNLGIYVKVDTYMEYLRMAVHAMQLGIHLACAEPYARDT